MADCWKEEPRSRPSFYQLIEKLEVIMERDAPYLHLNEHNEDRPYYNVPPEANVFSSYACNSLNHKGIKHHPGDIVEAGCLAVSMYTACFLKWLENQTKINLSLLWMKRPYRGVCMEGFDHILGDSFVIILIKGNVDKLLRNFQGKLSDLQLEGVLYACQRHQMVLANGQRAGFFIGDGAGVGKGRQIAGIVLDNFARGRSRHIWFSISADLRLDAQRDLHDIGCFVKVIDGCQQLDKETRYMNSNTMGTLFRFLFLLIGFIIFLTGANRQSRLQQLIDWCGGEQFNGCLIFDECHKAKHFVPVSNLQ
ncbi:unnamed protein product [Porites lobata]|uniref:Strawberry notch AAA domain-containing protein n=1 Tax=Porites lobata TaxID=104759 RepID=A0ABN8MRL0_9CNID|nr:unnamed protein product [Porites lobata]